MSQVRCKPLHADWPSQSPFVTGERGELDVCACVRVMVLWCNCALLPFLTHLSLLCFWLQLCLPPTSLPTQSPSAIPRSSMSAASTVRLGSYSEHWPLLLPLRSRSYACPTVLSCPLSLASLSNLSSRNIYIYMCVCDVSVSRS